MVNPLFTCIKKFIWDSTLVLGLLGEQVLMFLMFYYHGTSMNYEKNRVLYGFEVTGMVIYGILNIIFKLYSHDDYYNHNRRWYCITLNPYNRYVLIAGKWLFVDVPPFVVSVLTDIWLPFLPYYWLCVIAIFYSPCDNALTNMTDEMEKNKLEEERKMNIPMKEINNEDIREGVTSYKIS